MKSVALRFWIYAGLFAAWIAFLAYLAFTSRNPVILSRPQILASTLDIVGEVENPATGQVADVRVLWPQDQKGKWEGKTIKVTNLDKCVRFEEKDKEKADRRTVNEIWTAPGRYILPLVEDGKGNFEVAIPQRSPGFEPSQFKAHPHIYPATEAAERQLAEIRKVPQ
jgi:hypothetical protein